MKKRLKILPKKVLLVLLAIVMVVMSIVQYAPLAVASSSIWVNSGELQFHIEGDPSQDLHYSYGIPCENREEPVRYVGRQGNSDVVREAVDDCLIDLGWTNLSRSGKYAKPPHASFSRGISSGYSALPVRQGDKAYRDIVISNTVPSIRKIQAIKNPGLEEGSGGAHGSYKTYGFDYSGEKEFIMNVNGTELGVQRWRWAFSQNGTWMIALGPGSVILRINLLTHEVLASGFANVNNTSRLDFAISNDGNFGFYGHSSSARIVDFSTCGEANQNNSLTPAQGCLLRNVSPDLISEFGGSGGATLPEFSGDGTVLSFNTIVQGAQKRIAVVAPGHEYSGLDYLALGDSFASGEGDLEGEKYYLEGTDLPATSNTKEEKCHISRRSYPYLLAQKMHLSGNRFKSVACSGATTKDIIANKDDYEGQGGRLKDSQEDLTTIHDRAIEEFTPGYAPQLEFVERYKPKAVSLSIGGNDVDFNNVIIKCLMPGTCGYVDDSFNRRSKAQEVQRLSYRLEQVYKKIHEKSRNTKIFVIGYPKIAKKDGICGSNVKFNEAEREFLAEGVEYINEVTQAAAQRAGVAYIDVEDSLGEGVLCGNDSDKSMNGLTRGDDHLQTLISIMSNHLVPGIGNESYHPNQRGHIKMANAIWSATNNQGLLNYNYCPAPSLNYCPDTQVSTPSIPGYFGPDLIPVTPQRADIVEQWAQPGDMRNFKAPYLLKPNSNVELEIHSNPVSLGTFTTDSRGEFDEDIEIPDTLEPGMHTIHLRGTLLSDEEVHMYQTILVVGPEDDVDGDGISDDQQECYFVESAGIDADFDGVDDGCDGDAGEPQLYRVRNGDTGNSENEDWLYIERNIRAASVTGVQNDYDPNDDGWAIVGQSATSADSGVPASFWVDEQNVPHVSIRHPETGCTQFTAVTLSEVEQGQTRGLTQEAANTDTCREEVPEYDSDWDGVPDNIQTLYRVRNGDANESESPDNVYIERNITAAEAQLGITDFSHAQNGWSIVGASNGDSMQGTITSNLVIEGGIPYVCIDHATNGQTILTPESLSYVKQSDIRKLKVETSISINCDA